MVVVACNAACLNPAGKSPDGGAFACAGVIIFIACVNHNVRGLNLYGFRAPPTGLFRLVFVVAFPANGVRGSGPNLFSACIAFAELNVLIERVALKVIFKDHIPAVFPERRKRQVKPHVFPRFLHVGFVLQTHRYNDGGKNQTSENGDADEKVCFFHFNPSARKSNCIVSKNTRKVNRKPRETAGFSAVFRLNSPSAYGNIVSGRKFSESAFTRRQFL